MRQKVNLNAYFERIGFAGSIAPTLATLEQIVALHAAVIPFENLDILLGLTVSLELDDICDKLVAERRGGYCYEHNILLMAVLEELDFIVRGLSARVVWSLQDDSSSPASHMLLSVEIGGASYIVDVGFGKLTLTGPLRLKSEAEQTTPHEIFRLTGGEPDWQLEARIGEMWRPLYIFDLTPQGIADYAASNLVLSSASDSPFRQELRVALSPVGQRLRLRNSRFTVETLEHGSDSRFLISVDEMRDVLASRFGLQLPSSDLCNDRLQMLLTQNEFTDL